VGGPLLADHDHDRLLQVLANLISNAIKFTPAGGVVHVRLRTREAFAEIEGADSGTGIRDGDTERIFERLYRSGAAVAQQVPGAGLGLTIALAIAQAHDGRISLVKNDATGATFRMDLPLAR